MFFLIESKDPVSMQSKLALAAMCLTKARAGGKH